MASVNEEPGNRKEHGRWQGTKSEEARTAPPDIEIYENLPDELKQLRQWVGLKLVPQKGKKPTKVPINPASGRSAAVDEPATWGTFQDAVAAVSRFKLAGIGFVFTKDDPYAGIDLDGCRDPATGELDPWALDVVQRFDSYTEASVSGTGAHIIATGTLPRGGGQHEGVEMYDRGRYFVMTGAHVSPFPTTIEARQGAIDALYAEHFPHKGNGEATTTTSKAQHNALWRDLFAALPFIPAVEYDTWLKVGMGLHSVDSSKDGAGYALWVEWSQTCPEKFALKECKKRWEKSFTPNGGITEKTIFDLAIKHGWRSAAPEEEDDSPRGESPNSEPSWPVLAEEALSGLAGKIVRTIDPYTEADPVAVLLNILTAFGNSLNGAPHARVQHDNHPARLFVVQVGDTSKGRKGTGWSTPRYLMSLCDADWSKDRVKSGLSSGEGLIYNVRDPVYTQVPIKEKGRFTGEYEEVCTDQGEDDKRLMIVEPEFASVLTVGNREGNTLSVIIRQAWDSGNLSPLTKNNPIKATGAHISIIGHITKQELLARLDDTSKANGFANRFLWALVKRSKELPEGGAVPDELLAPLKEKLAEVIAFARTVNEVKRDEEARALWAAVYHDLSEAKPGMLGAVLGRAEAQVLRVCVIFTLLDKSAITRVEHLRAALALWEYCERSAVLIFGDRLGDPTADRILEALRNAGDAGMTENDIHNLFGRNKSANERARALNLLASLGLAEEHSEDTGGRPRTVWRTTR